MAKRESSTHKQKQPAGAPLHTADVTLKFTFNYPGYGCNIREHKILIARTLNELVSKGQLVIYGYLINVTEIYLVPACEKRELGAVQKLITDALKRMMRSDKTTGDIMNKGYKIVDMHSAELNCIVIEDALVTSLFTGGRLRSPFNKYYYRKLQKQILNGDFSSAIEYSGGVGPVIMVCKVY
ncbi:hypothetical protein EWM62_06880 [Mucilaginibacter terrigena]|uniref:Uncharacterized protein n=1 Tax=Mucilaginibacter terrigena TaxID=2492395 RepID=A0A4Q5LQJ1_9SPHI|nr:hypothetical protein [Mucilaginibacter terrigena]RYU91657.1 hypothetical protein EWM62_06880 [Mucilaginibacter terrigena]